ncbi:hypothetical protein AVEN_34986-1 [Araneus ventricosus]|uniref:DUF4817 domain-containing protein n=1 Tax=Araneus ventricosus TaxID=182803 RepID=A0A4Y2DEP2_ARAVE|nr:hypothetical protein AVEN_34986-1 [Araneus ventricosus]
MCVLWFFETKSVITTQRRFRTTYKKYPPSDNSIRRWLTQFQETGSVLHRKGARRPSTSQENVDRIQETFTRSPRNVHQEHCVQQCSSRTLCTAMFIKNIVYKTPVPSLDELKRRIVTAIPTNAGEHLEGNRISSRCVTSHEGQPCANSLIFLISLIKFFEL